MYAQSRESCFRGLANQQGQAPAPAAPQTQSASSASSTSGCAGPSGSTQAAPGGALDAAATGARSANRLSATTFSPFAPITPAWPPFCARLPLRSGMQVEGLGGDERVFGSFGPGATARCARRLARRNCVQPRPAWRSEQRRAARTYSHSHDARRGCRAIACASSQP